MTSAEATQADLLEDFAAIRVHCEAAIASLHKCKEDLEGFNENIFIGKSYVVKQLVELCADYVSLQSACESQLGMLMKQQELFEEFFIHKTQLQHNLRLLQSMLGAVLAAGNWQSPSIHFTRESQAGGETGLIKAITNDYKRDRHRDEQRYAKQFINAYVENKTFLKPIAFVTSSGMAAVLTTLTYVHARMPASARVLVGNATYFQSRWILESIFPNQIEYCDENNVDEIIAKAKKLNPILVFLDTLSNNAHALVNIEELLPRLQRVLSKDASIVLDNTGLALFCQPHRYFSQHPFSPQLFVIESLSKYQQFGLDRVNGGVVWSPLGFSLVEMKIAHANCGTIVPDMSILSHPAPNKDLLEQRLLRIGRNTSLLAQKIDTISRSGQGLVVRVVYPGLPTHPAYEWARRSIFTGGFFSCEFSSAITASFSPQILKRRLLTEAERRGISLVEGVGFGFDVTRVYLLPPTPSVPKTVLRVSAGIETMYEIERLADLFEDVLIGKVTPV